ncbi:MAG TPA: biotin--[acetyl-CoA-carboxylase] ligase [Terriglobales bacterium]|nr:biotin--[acetyl-CoA-carboxylase] ligase [Terriglobales bacterium]
MEGASDTLQGLRAWLPAQGLGAELHYFATLDSTQAAALAAGQAGAPEGALFVAERQTRGRGRHGHSWSSPPGAGIYASLLLRPRRPAAALLPLTLAAALAVADAVGEVAGLEPEIRWPNDLLLGGKKFCGLLIETTSSGGEDLAVLGFGINVRPQAWPPELAELATTLDQHTPQPIPRAQLCAAVVRQVERRYRTWSAGGDAALLQEFAARCPGVRGRAVVVGGAGDPAAAYTGHTEGLEPSGFLRVRLQDGSLRVVTQGDVRPE